MTIKKTAWKKMQNLQMGQTMGKSRYSALKKDDVLKAIKGSYGIISTISKNIGCNPHTAKKLIDKWEETQNAYEDECDLILDKSESLVYKSIEEGDIQTAKWVLSRKGKSRGWNEDNTIKLANGDPLNINLGGEAMSRTEIEEAGNLEIPDYDKDEE